jgi:hypothetical protein
MAASDIISTHIISTYAVRLFVLKTIWNYRSSLVCHLVPIHESVKIITNFPLQFATGGFAHRTEHIHMELYMHCHHEAFSLVNSWYILANAFIFG